MDSDDEKILIAGDVLGKLSKLFARVKSVSDKCGPFDSLFCVGSFFDESDSEWSAFKNGILKAPISTYILGPNNNVQEEYYSGITGNSMIQCLGSFGVYTTEKGLKIAYISGLEGSNVSSLNLQNAKKLCDLCKCGSLDFLGVDVLLTSPWPENVTSRDASASFQPKKPSKILSWLVCQLKPRYHICGYEGVAYERPPFTQILNGRSAVTRFIALAAVGNNEKQRWLYALNLKPLSERSGFESYANQTPSPFEITEIDGATNVQYFYDTGSKNNQPKRKRHKPSTSSGCWFCLSEENVERHLIVDVKNLSYLALARGGLQNDHLIITSVGHHSSVRNSPREMITEIDNYKKTLRVIFEKQDKVPVVFERNFKSFHFQIQVVPINKEFSGKIKGLFQKEAKEWGFKFEEFPLGRKSYAGLSPEQSYMYVELSDVELLHIISSDEDFPIQFGRFVLAECFGIDKKARWQDFVESKEKETELTQKFRKVFEKYDSL